MTESASDAGDSLHETIRCICGFSDDDGFTVQCEKCLVWQHCACVAEDGETLPDVFFCERCNPDPNAYNVQVNGLYILCPSSIESPVVSAGTAQQAESWSAQRVTPQETRAAARESTEPRGQHCAIPSARS